MSISRFYNKRPIVSGIIIGLLFFVVLELVSIQLIGIKAINDSIQTWLKFKEYPVELTIVFFFIPSTSFLVGLGMARRITISRFFSNRPTAAAVIAGILFFTILEGFSMLVIGLINSNIQTRLWFMEYSFPLYIHFLVIPLISTLLGIGLAKKRRFLSFFAFFMGIGIIAYLSYYLVLIFQIWAAG